jgi:hypothetical protein
MSLVNKCPKIHQTMISAYLLVAFTVVMSMVFMNVWSNIKDEKERTGKYVSLFVAVNVVGGIVSLLGIVLFTLSLCQGCEPGTTFFSGLLFFI